jgi:hypothetical protein
MRAAIATIGLALVACEGSEPARLSLTVVGEGCADPPCRDVHLAGQGLYVVSAEPTSNDALATEAGMLTFFGETRTSSGTTVVVELAFNAGDVPTRARYREIGENGGVIFRGEIRALASVPGAHGRGFRFTAINREDPEDIRAVFGEIVTAQATTTIPTTEDPDEYEDTGCGGEVIVYPDPDPTNPDPIDPGPSPDPDPIDPSPGPGPAPDPSDPAPAEDSGCEGDTTSDTSSSSCEGDTTDSSSSSSCEGDSASSSSSSSCEGDTASSSSSCDGGGSSSASSSCSGCEGDVAAASCVPMLPLERILGSLFRMFGPISLVGWWNRRKRGRDD